MERMTPDTDKREGLGEGIYAKFVQNYEKLLEENKKLKEENLLQLAEIRRLREYLGEYKRLKKENRKLREELFILNKKY